MCLVYTRYTPQIYFYRARLRADKSDLLGILQEYSWDITCLEGYVTGTEQTHKVFSMYIPGLRHRWSYTMYIPGIYIPCIYLLNVYDRDITSINLKYYKYIPITFQEKYFSGANWVCWPSLSGRHNACKQ